MSQLRNSCMRYVHYNNRTDQRDETEGWQKEGLEGEGIERDILEREGVKRQ